MTVKSIWIFVMYTFVNSVVCDIFEHKSDGLYGTCI